MADGANGLGLRLVGQSRRYRLQASKARLKVKRPMANSPIHRPWKQKPKFVFTQPLPSSQPTHASIEAADKNTVSVRV